MSLANRLTALAQAVGADIKALNTKVVTATKTLDPWHIVGATGEPVFTNGAFGAAAEAAPAFRKDLTGRVMLRGSVSVAASGTVVFVLPVGYRPLSGRVRTTSINNQTASGWAQVNVGTDGTVTVWFDTLGGVYVSLDQIEFDTSLVSEISVVVAGAAQGSISLDAVHVVGAVGEPAFQGTWAVFDPARPPRFRKDPFGKVRLSGVLKSGGIGTTAWVLPEGFRPPANTAFSQCTTNTGLGEVDITSTGLVVPVAGGTNYFFLDGVEFDTETVTVMPTGPQGAQGVPGSALFTEIPLVAATSYTIAGLDGDLDYGYEFYLMGSIPAGTTTRNCVIVPNALTVPANAALKSYRTGFYRENNALTVDNLVTDGIGFMFAPAYTTTALPTLNSHATLVARTGSERVCKAEFEASDASTIFRILHGTALSKWTDTATKITALRFLSDGAFTGKLFWRKMVP